MKSKEQKRTEAVERQAKYDALTNVEKYALIHSRRGASLREFRRLVSDDPH